LYLGINKEWNTKILNILHDGGSLFSNDANFFREKFISKKFQEHENSISVSDELNQIGVLPDAVSFELFS